MQEHRTPYRIVVAANGFRRGRSYKRYSQIIPTSYAYMGWQEQQSYQEARLPGAGSFLYAGMYAVRRAALEYLASPNVHQVQIRTNQDRKVYIFNKHSDGRITGYGNSK